MYDFEVRIVNECESPGPGVVGVGDVGGDAGNNMDMGVQLFRYSVLTSDDVRKIDENPCKAVDRRDTEMPKVMFFEWVQWGGVDGAWCAPFSPFMFDFEGRTS